MKEITKIEEKHITDSEELVTILNNNFQELEGRTTTMLSKAGSIETEIKSIKGDIKLIQKDIIDIKKDVLEIKGDIIDINKDVVEIKEGLFLIIDHFKIKIPKQILKDSEKS